MHYTLEALLKGQESILEYYAAAKTKWQELFADDKTEDWAKWIAREETAHFEAECGGMFIGREVMAWSAFTQLYSIQFGWREPELAKAQKLVDAFAASDCSPETKAAAEKAAASYAVESSKAHSETEGEKA